jgi:hypothetical protein
MVYAALRADQVNCRVGDVEVDFWGRARKFTPLRAGRPWFRAFHMSWRTFSRPASRVLASWLVALAN